MTETSNSPLTRYRILTSEDGVTFTLRGSQDANNREQALRKFFESPPDLQLVAVSEASFRPVRPKPKVVETTTYEEVSVGEPVILPPDPEPVPAFSGAA